MKFSDLNNEERSRKKIRVVNVGRYRMMKDYKNGKVMKKKSEIYGL